MSSWVKFAIAGFSAAVFLIFFGVVSNFSHEDKPIFWEPRLWGNKRCLVTILKPSPFIHAQPGMLLLEMISSFFALKETLKILLVTI